MDTVTKETVVTEGNNEVAQTEITAVESKATSSQTVQYLIYFFFGALNVLLVFRFILKLFGANALNSFVGLIYGITGIFVAPFSGIFSTGVSEGLETTSIFEPATIVAILVYLLIAWGIVKLINILSGRSQTE